MSHVYHVQLRGTSHVYVVAETSRQAADVFITWVASHDEAVGDHEVKTVDLGDLPDPLRDVLHHALELGVPGVAHEGGECGWMFSAATWSFPDPLDGEAR